MASKKPTLLNILSETSRIITTHPLHFSTLSALFLFPISFLTTNYYPYLLYHTFLHFNNNPFLNSISPTPTGKKTEIPQLVYTSLALILNISAVSSITRTTINALHYHSLQLIPTLKSTLVSHDQILGTKAVTTIVMGLTVFAFGQFMLLFVLIGLKRDYTSIYYIAYFLLTLALLAAVMVYFRLQWCVMYPVVVSESMSGFAALKRSSYLVKGMTRVALLMMVLFGILSLVMSMWYMKMMAGYKEGRGTGWVLVPMVVYACFVTALMLFNIVADTVLFFYCKELHDEPVPQIDDKPREV